MKYDVKYFIKKFRKIPDSLWCTGEFRIGKRRCALGWCGAGPNLTTESEALERLIPRRPSLSVTSINDGDCMQYKQNTPKARILAALDDLRP